MDFVITGSLLLSSLLRGDYFTGTTTAAQDICAQQDPWQVPASLHLPTPPSSSRLAEWISEAVRHDTSVYDDWGPLNVNSSADVKDKYAKTFKPFEQWLETAFPNVHRQLRKEVINEHGLLFTWQGSDQNAKPLLLMAHQDVVPVEPSTTDTWVHEPFSGFIDEKNQVVWGRGSSDDKSGLIGIMSALETLAAGEVAFQPKRTILASFGFDEESSGSGAESLASFIHSRYADDGIAFIVDEGDEVVRAHASQEEGGVGIPYAAVATAEKGYADIKVIVNTPGGHSSHPPMRTGIGLLSRIVAALEDRPPKVQLGSPDHPALARYLCLRDAPALQRRRDLARALHQIATRPTSRSALSLFLSSLEEDETYDFKTTQAVDIIQGGVKINALPERSVATVNYRIDVTESVDQLKMAVAAVVKAQARKLGLEYRGWLGHDAEQQHLTHASKAGSVHLEIVGPLEPAPRTPLIGQEAAPWRLLSSVIGSVWTRDEHNGTKSLGKSLPVVPSLMGGNTDTKSYWSLSRNIFRFSGGSLVAPPDELQAINGGIHTVNEYVQIDSIIKGNEFYTKLVLAVQEWDG